MSSTMTVSEARAALPQVLDRVEAGEEVTLTRHGRAVAVLVRPDTLRARRANTALAGAAAIGKVLEQGRKAPLRATLDEGRGDELVAEVWAGRARR